MNRPLALNGLVIACVLMQVAPNVRASAQLPLQRSVIATPDTPTVTSFSINDNMVTMETNNAVYLVLRYTGPVTQYRVSEVSDQFPESTAGWRPFVQIQAFGGSVYLPTPDRDFATLAGTKRVYLQLRSAVGVSNIVNDSITLLHTYKPSGREAVDVARTKGFVFSPPGSCDYMPATTVYGDVFGIRLVGSSFSDFTCAFTLFGGRSLAPGWRIQRLTWQIIATEGNCRTSGGPPMPMTSGTMPFFFIGRQCGFILRTVELKGPAGTTWQSAFGQ